MIRSSNTQKGFGTMELLLSVAIVAVSFAAMNKNMLFAYKTYKLREVSEAAFALAVDQMESFAVINAADLDDTDDLTDSAVTHSALQNITFTRVSDVTVNADTSRTIDITVSSNSSNYAVTKNYSVTFAVWE